jgi:hypothetical protein
MMLFMPVIRYHPRYLRWFAIGMQVWGTILVLSVLWGSATSRQHFAWAYVFVAGWLITAAIVRAIADCQCRKVAS